MNIKKQIPNIITSGNLVSGCLGIIEIIEGNLVLGTYFMILAAVFDFFDGFAARLLKVSSPMGKEMDSLADMVTFGVLPGMLMMQLLTQVLPKDSYLVYAGLILPVFSAFRLAKFNIDTRQTDTFLGVPTPAMTLLVCTLPFLFDEFLEIGQFLNNAWFLISISIIISILMVSDIPMLAMKFKNYSWGDNKARYIFALGAVPLLIYFSVGGIPFVMMWYILLSVLNNLNAKDKS
ncbi:CDP-diacylglycerol--serine O-phosphatidyltransferase [Sediminitomix flava]|uniref:CDP-diacylglycerol--serine O-phosphatidyltransferase n=1 Tax=Sediminitomix flava TaxID=379075 RepID=A0A315ZBR3_SEDFL|nr:CDP-diacylglycerol--serine O-phosphatidyltransferase [Sediminitomix flava]PWJ42154.1 CDP-diacylglycerol--serine O-phosphatidyltransferase [Sediminitomix flava]